MPIDPNSQLLADVEPDWLAAILGELLPADAEAVYTYYVSQDAYEGDDFRGGIALAVAPNALFGYEIPIGDDGGVRTSSARTTALDYGKVRALEITRLARAQRTGIRTFEAGSNFSAVTIRLEEPVGKPLGGAEVTLPLPHDKGRAAIGRAEKVAEALAAHVFPPAKRAPETESV
jgi:hypothetical protein